MKNSIWYLLCVCVLSACSVNKDLMFKTPKGYEFDQISFEQESEYRISKNDLLSFRLFTNDGFKLIDLSSGELGAGGAAQFGSSNLINYLVELDGRIELPTIGRVMIDGLTLKEAEQMLEDAYLQYYKKPFVMLNVINRRVMVSTGSGGTSRVINLTNNNITVIEAIASAGGIADRGNASKIKVIRRDGDKTKVFQIDLSTIEGVRDGNLIVQADDIIYVEPTPQIAGELVRDIAPIVSLITSAIFIISVINAN
ncbi:MAG: polysaccharide export protein EpsE [Flavobacteriales bacterium]|nr:polysaccharide export protein EpsE [Flavobacteriales bacterium]